MTQLALPLQLADYAVFSSFLADGNEALVATLRSVAAGEAESGCWLWGEAATGKTHLLQAVCDVAGDNSAYLPMSDLKSAGPGILQGLGNRQVICIDDAPAVLGDADWELALFTLVNELTDHGGRLVIAAPMSPRESGIALPDLASRVSRLPVFWVAPLSDNGRMSALQLRAHHRGLTLPDETASYLLTRGQRDMASLYQLLDRLDTEALVAQRRLTVPFVRDVLARD